MAENHSIGGSISVHKMSKIGNTSWILPIRYVGLCEHGESAGQFSGLDFGVLAAGFSSFNEIMPIIADSDTILFNSVPFSSQRKALFGR